MKVVLMLMAVWLLRSRVNPVHINEESRTAGRYSETTYDKIAAEVVQLSLRVALICPAAEMT